VTGSDASDGSDAVIRRREAPAGPFPRRGVRRQFGQALAIAENTARELVRNPAYAVLVGSGAALSALSPAFALFHLGEQVRMIADLGLGTTLVVAVLTGVFGASWAVSEELERRSAVAILAKPLPRWAFLLGKYMGVLAAAVLAVALSGLALLLTLRAVSSDAGAFLVCACVAGAAAAAGSALFRRLGLPWPRAVLVATGLSLAALLVALDRSGPLAAFGRRPAGWAWALAPALAGIVLQVSVLAAVAVALATRLPLSANLPAVLALFVLGQLAGELRIRGAAAAAMGALLPDMGVFQFSDAVAQQVSEGAAASGAPVSAGVLLIASGVACMYVIGALVLGSALFVTRDVG